MYLLDTKVVSELRKVRAGKADARVAAWADSVEASDLYLSVITLQEIAIGVFLAERRDPVQGAVLKTWFKLLPFFLTASPKSIGGYLANPIGCIT